jgi:hypothetical protein
MFSLRPRCLSLAHTNHVPNLGRTRVALAKVVDERDAIGLSTAEAVRTDTCLSDGWSTCLPTFESAHAKSSARDETTTLYTVTMRTGSGLPRSITRCRWASEDSPYRLHYATCPYWSRCHPSKVISKRTSRTRTRRGVDNGT